MAVDVAVVNVIEVSGDELHKWGGAPISRFIAYS